MTTNNLRVVLLAHVFPRALDDSMGAFLLHLVDALAARDTTIDVVAPHAAGLANDETLSAARVHRFHYAPAQWENLAYRGTMHEIVGRGIAGKILFALFNLAFLAKALAVVWAARPHVIHAHWWLPGGLVGALASLTTHVPLVITTHGTDVEMLRRTRWAKPLARFVFNHARTITCGSSYLREQLVELGVVDASRVCVVPMPVNSEIAIQGSQYLQRTSVQVFATRHTEILTVARLTAQKSINTLIDALAILRARGSAAKLKIIGAGPERAALEAQTQNLKLQERIEFLGALPQTELPKYYAECAVFVLPSIREGMGLVLAEALLCGAPVVAANSGGVTDIVRDGATGLLFRERDAHALADTIEKLLSNRALALQIASNGATWVRAHFTRECVAEQFMEIYHF